MRGVILYGPPASGKDTVTAALHQLDSRYIQFRRLKAGAGRTAGYRAATDAALDALRATGDVVWENRRYGARYVVDEPGLREQLTASLSVVHLGQVEAVDALLTRLPDVTWTVAYLWCPREVAATRAAQRGTGDVAERLKAWDETAPLDNADLVVDTAQTRPETAAQAIDDIVRGYSVPAA